MSEQTKAVVVELLEAVRRAHHAAFSEFDGRDPDWPIWYAEFLAPKLSGQLGLELSRSQLVYCLMSAESEHQAIAADAPWAEFYADQILDHFAPSDNPMQDTLALYHYDGCPFCSIVRQAIDTLGIDVELRDILRNPQYREELIAARGRSTVPVLRITSPSGEEHWMPESRDIRNYLTDRYG